MFEIQVLSFAGEPLAQPLGAPLGESPVTVGRSSECVLHLSDPERHISRVQMSVRTLPKGLIEVSNVSAANPVSVSDKELGPGEMTVAPFDVELRVGLYSLRVYAIASSVQSNVQISSAAVLAELAAEEKTPLTRVFASPHSGTATEDTLENWNVPTGAGDPFSDLFGTGEHSAAAAPIAFSSHRTPPSPIAALPGAVIPDDFDPFALPSATLINTDDPLKALKKDETSSLRDFFEKSEDANQLISPTLEKPVNLEIDPVLGNPASGLGRSASTDPLALFSSAGGAGEIGSLVSAPTPTFPSKSILDQPSSELTALTKFSDVNAESAPQAFKPAQLTSLPSTLANPSYNAKAVPPARSFESRAEQLESSVNASPPVPPQAEPSRQSSHLEISPALLPTQKSSVDGRPEPQETQSVPKPVAALSASPVPALVPDTASATQVLTEDKLLSALLDGLGIQDLDIPGGMSVELMKKIGEILRVSFDGTVEMMLARAVTKREVRTDVTMILSEKNNPIKFAPDGRAAIMHLLSRPFPGFMAYDEAIRDAYEDLRAHEVGVLAGMRAALSTVLGRFKPESLEKLIGSQGGVDTVLPQLRKAKLWDEFTRRYGGIVGEAEDNFQTLFGKAFREEYEAEVAKIRAQRSPE